MRSLGLVALSLLAVAAACTTSEAINTSIDVATAVAEAAIQREISGGCYALCGEGTHCNRETGFCERTTPKPGAENTIPEFTLADKCQMVRRDMIADRNRGLGDQHPAMVGYSRTLERCDKLLASTSPADRICGMFELELVALESDGFGTKHPDVVAQQALLDKCRADVAAHPPAPP